jgi:hypothetical protein
VTSIGVYAFYGCSGLTNIAISTSVTSIDSSTFYECITLNNITIPNSVTSIGSSAFYGCSGLTNIAISTSTTSIGDSAFQGCTTLDDVTIPNSVTSIGSSAFNGCSGLTNIAISTSTTSIGGFAFHGCITLNNVTIPTSVTSISDVAFYNCNALNNVYFNNANTLISLGSNLFLLSGYTFATVTFYNMASASNLSTTADDLLPYFSTVHYVANPPPCFHPNTRLLCFNETTDSEEWVKIMDLYKDKDKSKSKKVKTYLHGYRAIENIGKGYMINNPQHKIKCMYRSTELLEKELNVTELMVTGAHAILLDSTQHSTKSRHFKSVDNKWLVRACDVPAYFEKVTEVTPFDFYHLSLSPCPDFSNDNNGICQTIFGIYVNGDSNSDKNMCLMETIDDAVFKKSMAFL